MSLFPEKYHHYKTLNKIVCLHGWKKRKAEAEEYLDLVNESLKQNPLTNTDYHELHILRIHLESVIEDCKYRIKNI